MRTGKAAPNTIDDYIAAIAEPARGTLAKVCATIRSAVPPETTEGISYGMPMFKYKGMLIGFAAFSKHCSLFPGPPAIAAFKDELKGYPTSKGTIQFPMDKPFPPALLKKMLKIRVAENDGKKKR